MYFITDIIHKKFQLQSSAGAIMNISSMAAASPSATRASTAGPSSSPPSSPCSFYQFVSHMAVNRMIYFKYTARSRASFNDLTCP